MRCIIRAKKRVTRFRTFSIFCRWKGHLACQCRCEKGWRTLRRSNKNGGLFDMNAFFVCLPLLHELQTKCDLSEEKQVILAPRAWVRHHTEQYFIYPGEIDQVSASELTWRRHLVKCHAGDDQHSVARQCSTHTHAHKENKHNNEYLQFFNILNFL